MDIGYAILPSKRSILTQKSERRIGGFFVPMGGICVKYSRFSSTFGQLGKNMLRYKKCCSIFVLVKITGVV